MCFPLVFSVRLTSAQHDPAREKKLQRILEQSQEPPPRPAPTPDPWSDVWAPGTQSGSKRVKRRSSRMGAVAVQPTHGLSYRPDPRAHADQVAVATAFVIAQREERIKWERSMQVPDEVAAAPDDTEKNDRALKRMSNFLLGIDNDDDDDDGANDDNGEDDSSSDSLDELDRERRRLAVGSERVRERPKSADSISLSTVCASQKGHQNQQAAAPQDAQAPQEAHWPVRGWQREMGGHYLIITQ